jgi:hypothetical protein
MKLLKLLEGREISVKRAAVRSAGDTWQLFILVSSDRIRYFACARIVYFRERVKQMSQQIGNAILLQISDVPMGVVNTRFFKERTHHLTPAGALP